MAELYGELLGDDKSKIEVIFYNTAESSLNLANSPEEIRRRRTQSPRPIRQPENPTLSQADTSEQEAPSMTVRTGLVGAALQGINLDNFYDESGTLQTALLRRNVRALHDLSDEEVNAAFDEMMIPRTRSITSTDSENDEFDLADLQAAIAIARRDLERGDEFATPREDPRGFARRVNQREPSSLIGNLRSRAMQSILFGISGASQGAMIGATTGFHAGEVLGGGNAHRGRPLTFRNIAQGEIEDVFNDPSFRRDRVSLSEMVGTAVGAAGGMICGSIAGACVGLFMTPEN